MINNQNSFSGFFKNFPVFGIIIPILSFLMFITNGSSYLFYNDKLIIFYGHVWRLLIYFIATLSFIGFIFQILISIFLSYYYEKKFGSVNFIYNIFIYSLLIGILNLPISFLLSNLSRIFIGLGSSVGVYFYFLIIIRCFKNPEGVSVSICCPFPIKNKFFPFIYMFIGFLFNGWINTLDITNLIFGYLYIKFEKKFDFLILKTKYVKKIENKIKFLNKLGTIYYINDNSNSNFNSTNINTISSFNNNSNDVQNTHIKKEEKLEVKNYFGGKGVSLNENKNKDLTKEERREKILENLEKKKKQNDDKIKEEKEVNKEKEEKMEDEKDIVKNEEIKEDVKVIEDVEFENIV